MLAVMVVVLIVTMFLNIPIGICLGLSSLAGFMIWGEIDLSIVAQRMITGIDITTLLAIPMFLVAGKIMEKGGISRRIVDVCYAFAGWIPGSLGIVTVMACMFFAAISGSAPATVVAIGSIMVPMMVKDGYPASFAAALAASAGCIGVIIPPSIPFVNYAVLTGVSIADMFIAGVIPGFLMGFVLIGLCIYMSRKHGWGGETVPFSGKKAIQTLGKSVLAILMPIIILGGIYTGYFTPTEAAGVACVYSFIVAGPIYHELKLREIPQNLFDSALSNSMIMLIVGAASSFSWIMATQQVPAKLAELITGATDSTILVLLLINIILLINGCFMDLTASTFIYVPILFPLSQAMGVHPIQFGVMLVLNMTLGLITPPLGVNLFLGEGLHKDAKFGSICRQVVPMFILLVIVLMGVTYFEPFTTLLLND